MISHCVKKLCDKIRSLREQQGISQEDVANLADLSPNYYRGVEAGKHNLSVEVLLKISFALGTKASYFFEELGTDYRSEYIIHNRFLQKYAEKIDERSPLEQAKIFKVIDAVLSLSSLSFFDEANDIIHVSKNVWEVVPSVAHFDEWGLVEVYGIALYIIKDERRSVVDYIGDISTDKKAVQHLTDLMQIHDLDQVHFRDIVQDFLADEAFYLNIEIDAEWYV